MTSKLHISKLVMIQKKYNLIKREAKATTKGTIHESNNKVDFLKIKNCYMNKIQKSYRVRKEAQSKRKYF